MTDTSSGGVGAGGDSLPVTGRSGILLTVAAALLAAGGATSVASRAGREPAPETETETVADAE